MRKRKQDSKEEKKRVKRDLQSSTQSQDPCDRNAVLDSQGVPRHQRRTRSRFLLDIFDTEGTVSTNVASSSSLVVDATYRGRSRANFYLFLNLSATPVDGEGIRNSSYQEDSESPSNESRTFFNRLFETFFGSVLFLSRGNGGEAHRDSFASRTSYFEVRNLIINIFNVLNEDTKSPKKTVKKEDLDKIKTQKCSSDIEGKCSICLSTFEENEVLRLLKCKHRFHTACIDPWLLSSSDTCPMCREPVI